jgi:UDP-N-acetylmuramyl pentapeptide synthase
MSPSQIRVARTSEEAGAPVSELARGGDWILIKGSRAMKMERIAEHLEAEARS